MTNTSEMLVLRDMYSGCWNARNAESMPATFNHEQAAIAWMWGDGDAFSIDSRLDGSRIHHLKISSGFFAQILTGAKTFEIRRNDRRFEVGDTVVLHKILVPVDQRAETEDFQDTGETIIKRISSVIFSAPGLAKGFVILSFGYLEEDSE